VCVKAATPTSDGDRRHGSGFEARERVERILEWNNPEGRILPIRAMPYLVRLSL
jgi:hypothetical protein